MQTDLHDAMRHLIDKSLAGEASTQGLSIQEQQALREHLRACAQCESYADEGRRAIAALSGFSFDADPGLQEKVHAALALRVQQLQPAQPSRARIVQVTIAALLLTIAGSFAALHAGNLLAAVLHLPLAQAHTGLFTFWIAPSWCFFLLLPVLLLASARSASRKGHVL
jgi:anti-sigma factor RsiW